MLTSSRSLIAEPQDSQIQQQHERWVRGTLTLFHEDMHGEAFCWMRAALGYPAPQRIAMPLVFASTPLAMSGAEEWTSDAFAPYPGFEPGPYREYSQPWFGDHRELRGGALTTHARMHNPRYRNFFEPHRNDVFAGFRTVAL